MAAVGTRMQVIRKRLAATGALQKVSVADLISMQVSLALCGAIYRRGQFCSHLLRENALFAKG